MADPSTSMHHCITLLQWKVFQGVNDHLCNATESRYPDQDQPKIQSTISCSMTNLFQNSQKFTSTTRGSVTLLTLRTWVLVPAKVEKRSWKACKALLAPPHGAHVFKEWRRSCSWWQWSSVDSQGWRADVGWSNAWYDCWLLHTINKQTWQLPRQWESTPWLTVPADVASYPCGDFR